MTTREAEARYLAEHLSLWGGAPLAIYNPHGKDILELPIIFGFNNGGEPGWYHAELVSQDGCYLGGHICSGEGYMPFDLGCIEGARADRHEKFREHYPDGYRMEFVPGNKVIRHEGLTAAVRLLNKKRKELPE